MLHPLDKLQKGGAAGGGPEKGVETIYTRVKMDGK